ncbi:MAG: hypothetical protein IT254_10370 [Chitinophagaceae bacterium]|nr:hypothetical protein [Chitinophagaceae bacterium]MCW5916061.1 hypothetical protein [Ferruginibacter sp.]
MRFKRAITLPRDLKNILNDLNIQRHFIQLHIHPITSSFMKLNDGTLDDRDIQKIFNYYGLAVPAILGEAFCLLNGKKMTERERCCSTAQGAMTGLFDDFFDKQFLDEENIKSAIENNIQPDRSSNEALFSLFYQKALKTAPAAALVKQRLLDVYQEQLESKKQLGGALSYENLLELTQKKGATSLLFYYSAFCQKETAIENNLIAKLGGWMQLSNDIFDVYKDRESGIDTLVTTCCDIKGLKTLYLTGIRKCFSEARNLPFNSRNIDAFLNRLSIGIFSRALVCLSQLEKNQQVTGGKFEVNQYSRKQLICDMDTAENKLQSLLQHLQI